MVDRIDGNGNSGNIYGGKKPRKTKKQKAQQDALLKFSNEFNGTNVKYGINTPTKPPEPTNSGTNVKYGLNTPTKPPKPTNGGTNVKYGINFKQGE